MMHEELVGRLRELHPEEFGDAWSFAFACQQAMHEAADAIEELTTTCNTLNNNTMRLTSIEEGLPEDEDIQYLICKKRIFGDGFLYCVANYAKDLHKVDKYDFPPEDIGGFYGCDDEWGYYKHFDVTYWMPLYQPHQKEE